MIFILSGNADQAHRYARTHKIKPGDYQFLSGRYQLMGKERGSSKVIKTGLWYMRQDIAEINCIAKDREFELIVDDKEIC